PTLCEADVVVVGGGPAGMCAAIAAARAGLEVTVVERWPMVGGESTMSKVTIWHTSDKTREVIFGLTRELVERLKRYDGIVRYAHFPRHHETYYFSAEWMGIVWNDLIREHKIRTLCYTPCVDVLAEGRRVRGVVVGTKTGLKVIRGQMFVDATGSADVAHFAGAPTVVGREKDGKCQGMTLVSSVCGIDPKRQDELRKAHGTLVREMHEARQRGDLPAFGGFQLSEGRYMDWYGTQLCCISGDPLDPEDLTRCHMEARGKLPKFLQFLREHAPACEKIGLRWTAPSLGIREERRAKGLYTFGADDVEARRSFADAIGHGFWMVDIHDPEGSGHTTWVDRSIHLKPGETYQIPYRMLVTADVDNLFVAGRCASATHEGMAALRIQSHCHIMGQAAGTAAALCLTNNTRPADVDVAALQQRLITAGVMIDQKRVAAAAK
ncbi:FAD-dependent oxidoreductase, partial [bacterium]|nr:FAD-dependent oxidoreductase [bacterium]